MEIVYNTSERSVPTALANSEEFRNLNAVQQQNFSARLNYIEEICLKSQEWLKSCEDFESPKHFIDEIELDLLINLSTGEENRSVSPWLIHSSWTFNASPQSMLALLPNCLIADFTEVQIGFKCGKEEFSVWLKHQVDCMRSLLDVFYEADSFDCTIGSLIGIDICLSTLLSGVSKQRLNNKFE